MRLVSTEHGGLAIGPGRPGRGAWLCRGSRRCAEEALRRRALQRALRSSVKITLEELVALAGAHDGTDGPLHGQQPAQSLPGMNGDFGRRAPSPSRQPAGRPENAVAANEGPLVCEDGIAVTWFRRDASSIAGIPAASGRDNERIERPLGEEDPRLRTCT